MIARRRRLLSPRHAPRCVCASQPCGVALRVARVRRSSNLPINFDAQTPPCEAKAQQEVIGAKTRNLAHRLRRRNGLAHTSVEWWGGFGRNLQNVDNSHHNSSDPGARRFRPHRLPPRMVRGLQRPDWRLGRRLHRHRPAPRRPVPAVRWRAQLLWAWTNSGSLGSAAQQPQEECEDKADQESGAERRVKGEIAALN